MFVYFLDNKCLLSGHFEKREEFADRSSKRRPTRWAAFDLFPQGGYCFTQRSECPLTRLLYGSVRCTLPSVSSARHAPVPFGEALQ